jgi:DNA polymerase-3 subunit epsilon
MTPWHDGRLVALDTETTGINVEEARIVTAAIASCGGGLETQTLTLLADPGVEIPEEASAVHGVTTERARAEGKPAASVVSAVVNTLRAYTAGGNPIVGMNLRFDLTILDREARRHGIPPLVPTRVVDVLVLDKHLHRYRRGSRKLDASGAPLRSGARHGPRRRCRRHRRRSGGVVHRQAGRGHPPRPRQGRGDREERAGSKEWERVRHDIDLLHAAQIRWAAEQAESLEAYFRGQGKDEHVERAWPVVPVPVVA